MPIFVDQTGFSEHGEHLANMARRSGAPVQISTSYVERSNLSIRMGSRRFNRLTNGFSKKIECHAAAVSLYGAHYNWVRVHETLDTTPAVAIGITDHVWSIGELLDAALAIAPTEPTETAPERRRRFRGRPRLSKMELNLSTHFFWA